MSRTVVGNLCCTVSMVLMPTAIFFKTFLVSDWKSRCLSIVTPKYLHSFTLLINAESTITVSESFRRLSFLREKVINSVLPPFRFNLLRQKYFSYP